MKAGCYIILLWLIIIHGYTSAQVSTEKIRRVINSQNQLDDLNISCQYEIGRLYKVTGYSPLWINNSGQALRTELVQLLSKAADEGLNEQDYQYSFLQTFSEERFVAASSEDSLDVELKFSDAALHFFIDLIAGNSEPAFGYDGLKYHPNKDIIPYTLPEFCLRNELLSYFEKLAYPTTEIKSISSRLACLNRLTVESSIKEERITSTLVSHLNKPLIHKLYLLGISDSINKGSDRGIKESIREAQKQFNLLADGVLRSTILAELNVPLETRKQQLKLSINYYRWLFCLSRQRPVIVVNIPAAILQVHTSHGIVLEMRTVVGQASTRTPTLTSTITEVILYPYWHVPHSIAIKELLPAIKRNPGFIDANNFQIITSQGKIADPAKIDWQSLNASNFPYIIRQSTGCDNALGLIKLNFYNPVGVYLHDTPYKNLFMLNKRYFSHGCIRMEKPMEMGRMILKDNSIAIDTLEEKGCIYNQSPIVVPADEKMDIVVWYNPVGTDTTGRVIFYEDVYKKFSRQKPTAVK